MEMQFGEEIQTNFFSVYIVVTYILWTPFKIIVALLLDVPVQLYDSYLDCLSNTLAEQSI